jgi:hypothetical protein
VRGRSGYLALSFLVGISFILFPLCLKKIKSGGRLLNYQLTMHACAHHRCYTASISLLIYYPTAHTINL